MDYIPICKYINLFLFKHFQRITTKFQFTNNMCDGILVLLNTLYQHKTDILFEKKKQF